MNTIRVFTINHHTIAVMRDGASMGAATRDPNHHWQATRVDGATHTYTSRRDAIAWLTGQS